MKKLKLNYPLKIFLIATVISLLPVTLGVSPLDYKGASLEAAEDDKKKKKKRRRTKLPSKKMQRILQGLVPFIENEQWEEALLTLEPVAVVDSKFTSTDRAKMFYYRGYIYFSQEKYGLAERAYKNLIAEEDSSDQERQGAIYSLSQLRYIAEDYKGSITYLLEWLDNEEEPSSDGYGLLAQAYYQVENFQKSVEAIDTAIEIQESRDIPIKVAVLDAEGNETGEMIETGETRKGVAKENHYLLKMALYSELKKDLEVLPIYEILVQYYPKKRYWTNLSGLYGQRDRQMDQMGALEAAYDDNLLDKQREFTALSQLLFMFENPRKAAKVIEEGLNRGIVKKEEKTLKAAAQYWHAAKELERAKPYYLQAATKSKEGELFIFLGQVHFSLDEFDKAEKAIEDGLNKGKLKDEAAAYMLLGQINFENQKWESAIESFRKCIDVAERQFDDKKEKQKEKKKRVQDQARKWVTYTEGEEERVEALKLKRKALGV